MSHSGPSDDSAEPDLDSYFNGWLYRYRATWGAGGLVPGAYLRSSPLVTIASLHAWSTRCAATVPGAYTPPADDWEFLGTSGPPDPPDAGPDARPDAGPGTDTGHASRGTGGCASSTTPGPTALVLAIADLVAIAPRRRRG